MEYRPRIPDESVNVTPTHPLRELLLLVAGVSAAVVVFAVVVGFAIDVLVARIPPRIETRLFGALFDSEDALGTKDPRLEPTRALLARMAGHWPESPDPLRLGIAADDAPNAYALPGGTIMVTRGLLEQVESENDLAFVLAHELGHFRHRDHLRGLGRGLVLNLTLSAVLGRSAGQALPVLVSQLTQTGFSRENESNADGFALALVAAEYGHVAGADQFFLRTRDPGRFRIDDRFGSYFATHPLSDDRIDAVREAAEAAGWSRIGELTPLSPEFAAEGVDAAAAEPGTDD